jgi:hypothetical protein
MVDARAHAHQPRGPQRPLALYVQLFGVRECYPDDEQIQVQGPGLFDVLG